MYLAYFGINTYPFALTPDTDFFCDLPSHQAALNVLLFSVSTGEGFIKILGKVGTGKSLLCRKLLSILDDTYVTAYIPNPDFSPIGLKKAFARELGIALANDIQPEELQHVLYNKLLELHGQNKRVVLIIDEAQAMFDDSLETLRLLTNLETESQRLLQIVLFAQPELDERLGQSKFRQLNQRITFSHDLRPIRRKDLEVYLSHRLNIAGYQGDLPFCKRACDFLFDASCGIPRVINILSHKAMLVAYGQRKARISGSAMMEAIKDSRNISDVVYHPVRDNLIFLGALSLMAALVLVYFHFMGYF